LAGVTDETMKILSQDSEDPGCDLIGSIPECKSNVNFSVVYICDIKWPLSLRLFSKTLRFSLLIVYTPRYLSNRE
jgi:hypothetical protein